MRAFAILATLVFSDVTSAQMGDVHAAMQARQAGPTARLRSGQAEVDGALAVVVIRRVIRRRTRAVRRCYERALAGNVALAGTVRVTFRINAGGRVIEASITETPQPMTAVAVCVRSLVRRLRFPEPEDGGTVVVTYPFVFTSVVP